MVSSPRISKGPAGYRINRDFARRGWATETSDPNMGLRNPICLYASVTYRGSPPSSLVPSMSTLLGRDPGPGPRPTVLRLVLYKFKFTGHH